MRGHLGWLKIVKRGLKKTKIADDQKAVIESKVIAFLGSDFLCYFIYLHNIDIATGVQIDLLKEYSLLQA